LANLRSLQAEATQQSSSIQTIAANLGQGSSGASVATLQHFLIAQNKGPAAETLSKVGATAYFGALTRAALAEFQASVGISPALGNFGTITRMYISTHY
jgi:peptidoglycan hydrolase-like protein with peptidoglycan-binding domain